MRDAYGVGMMQVMDRFTADMSLVNISKLLLGQQSVHEQDCPD